MMDNEAAGVFGPHWPKERERTLSSMSQQSSQSLTKNFPLMTSDSGLYTCSSNNSDAALESDTDSCCIIPSVVKDESLQSALRDARRLRSDLERLTKSEQWYKQELRHQKSNRLEDLERIYSQERKYMQDNQRLQKECVRLYEKCSELERELQKNQQLEMTREQKEDTLLLEEDMTHFEMKQQSAIIQDQQQLISVLRKQKKSLLKDLRSLTDEKDEKVAELQQHLADLEFDNQRITKKCTDLSKERSKLAYNLKQSDSKLSLAQDEKLNLQKCLVSLREQLHIQEKLVKLKESEISQMQVEFKDTLNKEENLDEVHRLSLKYHEDINSKSLEIIELKNQLSNMQDEMESMEEIQSQNDQQQRLIEQLHFSLEACQLEMQELKATELLKTVQIEDLQQKTERLLQDNDEKHKQMLKQKHDFDNVCQELKITKEQYSLVSSRYKETQFKLEMLEIDQSKFSFQRDTDQREIERLRLKLTEYLKQTSDLVERIQNLELKLKRNVEENFQLKNDFEKLQEELKNLRSETTYTDKIRNKSVEFNRDFFELSNECKKLQNTLDDHSAMMTTKPLQNNDVPVNHMSLNRDANVAEYSLKDDDVSYQCKKLLQNTNILQNLLKEKENTINAISYAQQPSEGMANLLNENRILKERILEVESEANYLQLQQDITLKTQKFNELETLLHNHGLKEIILRKRLLVNDSKLYKIERSMGTTQEIDASTEDLLAENQMLQDNLRKERYLKTGLKTQLTQVKDQVDATKEALEQYKSKQKSTLHKGVQCDDIDKEQENIVQEVKLLKEQLLDLQNKQSQFEEVELQKSDERLLLMQKLSDLQNSKMQYLQDTQNDWEDLVKSLNSVQMMEEKHRKELELKRMELEELNQVFAEQNEELKQLEEFATLLEFKRHQEKEQLKQAFQKEATAMKQQLLEYKQEIEKQYEMNHQLQEKNNRIQQNYHEDYVTEIAEYRREVRSLKNKIGKTLNEKDDMEERIRELENELKEIKHNRREAVVLPQLASSDTSIAEINVDLSVPKSNVNEDHLRILTKVLEAEYARKMGRYDEHIHSLLANVNALKKSLKHNQEKTAILSEDQSRAMEELKELQNAKRNLEDLRFKYEQSQSIIKELRRELSLEKKKFDCSDLGKSSQNEISTYEVSNLIDDYKKLIRQSALVTKRPATSLIFDLIQRSNQYVPNLQNLESNIGDLRCDLQNFLGSCAQKLPSSSLITAASLTVPPSLMDELRAASEGF